LNNDKKTLRDFIDQRKDKLKIIWSLDSKKTEKSF